MISFCLGKGALSYRSVCHGDWNQDRILLLFYKKNNSSIYCRRRAYEPGIQQVRRMHCERGAPSPKDEFIATYSKGRWNCRCVDLSRKYFSLQMNDLLDKGAKSIRIWVFASRRYWYSQSRKHGWDGSRGLQANTDACSTLTKFTNRPRNIIVSGLTPPSIILSKMICLRSEDKRFSWDIRATALPYG